MKTDIEIALNQFSEKLKHQSDILLKGLNGDTELLLTELYKPDDYQPYYNHVATSLRKEKINLHDLQREISNKVIDYFLSYDSEVTIKRLYNNQLPSDLIISYQQHPILTFSFYHHTFADHRRGSESLVRQNEEDFKRLEELHEELDMYKHYNENILRFLHIDNYEGHLIKRHWGILRDIYLLIKVGRKRLRKHLKKTIKTQENKISSINNNIESRRLSIRSIEEASHTVDEKYELFREKLISLGYREGR